jgi:two-component sensor histidine kinase
MMAAEVSAPEARVKPALSGEFGLLPAAVATPLALVLTELLQNALQHGLTRPTGKPLRGNLAVTARRTDGRLTVTVTDNGVGLPEDFDLDSTASLGLQIVRTLVVAELGGRLEIAPQSGGGTRVLVEVPVDLPQDRTTEGATGLPGVRAGRVARIGQGAWAGRASPGDHSREVRRAPVP